MAKAHQVPQFYLKNFQIPGKPGLIYSYKRNLSPISLSIRRIVQGENYYDLKSTGILLPIDRVDQILQMSENATSPIIVNLLNAKSFEPSPEDFGHLIWFVALLALRTPYAREATANLHIATAAREFKKFAENKEAFASLTVSDAEVGDADLRERARLALLNDDIKLDLKRGGQTEDYLMGVQLGVVNKLAPILGRKYWHILETGNSRPFLTSDHPAVQLPSPSHRPGMDVGYADGWLLLPLSPKRALLLTNRRYSKSVMMITSSKMREYQWYIITRCYQSVFSHSLETEYQQILDTTKEGEVIRVYLPEK